jgi:hypothetical protein
MRKWHISDDWLMRDALTLLSVIDDERGRQVVRFEQHIEPAEIGTFVSHDVGLPLTPDDAQQIMNELWRAGVRPRDGAGTLAHVEAQKAHLEDMRRLVFEAERNQHSEQR